MGRIGPQRNATLFPRRGYGFHGEHSREGWTDEVYQAGFLYQLRNYHMVGRGRALKRMGSKPYVTATVNGAEPIQGMAMYEWNTTRKLLVACDGGLFELSGTSWTDRTGSIAFTTGKDNRLRFTQFYDGGTKWLIGTAPGNNRIWKWNGNDNAEFLTSSTAIGPNYARDIAEWRGRFWALNTQNGETILEYSDDAQASTWTAGNYIHCTRESPGMALSRHGKNALLVFHQRSIHAVRFDYQTVDPFTVLQLDERVGAVSTHGVAYSKGITYFAGQDGFYRIKSPTRPAEYIGYPMENVWAGVEQDRLDQIECFVRGEPWNEVVWLVSNGSGQHNIAFVWNTELETWSVFESTAGYFAFNTGVNFIDSNGKHLTLCGGYDGLVYVCWGDDQYDTGAYDEGDSGAPVQSVLETGLLDFGYPGVKRLREIWIDAIVSSNMTFNMQIQGINETPTVTTTEEIGTASARLSIDFTFDSSRFASENMPSQGQFKIAARSRMFKLRLDEQNITDPHTLNSFWLWWLPRARRFNA